MSKGKRPRMQPGGMPNQSAMLRQIQKMQEDMQAAQQALETETIDVSVGGGAITITITAARKSRRSRSTLT